jgi:hypothetical protein
MGFKRQARASEARRAEAGHWEAVITIRLPGADFDGHGQVINYVHDILDQHE